MSRKMVTLIIALVVAASLVGTGIYAYDFDLRDELVTRTYGDDPRILVSESRSDPLDMVWGRLRYDEQTRCLYLETSSSWETPAVLDRPVAVIWPKGSRPVLNDGRRGVRVGGFLGQFGGRVLYEGDLLFGSGGGGVVPEQTRPPGDDCRSGTRSVGFRTVERVDQLPDI